MVMVKNEPFTIIYAEEIREHLRAIEAKYHGMIQSAIETQLLYEPNVETRNRKPLKRPIEFGADWELRCGPDNRFHVFYQVQLERREVDILALGVKERNRLIFGTKEFMG